MMVFRGVSTADVFSSGTDSDLAYQVQNNSEHSRIKGTFIFFLLHSAKRVAIAMHVIQTAIECFSVWHLMSKPCAR